MVAPSAAPDETPVTYGSVSGLRKRSWRITPATASAAPTSAAVSTRGMRICQKMALSRSPLTGPAKSRCQIRPTDSEAGPRASASTRHTRRMPAARRIPGHVPVRASLVTGPRRASGWIMPASCLEALGQARAGPGDDAVVDDVDLAVLDGGELGEAGALVDVAGLAHRPGVGDVDRRVLAHQHLGAEVREAAAGHGADVLAAGDGDHVVDERVGAGRHERLAVDLEERRRLARGRRPCAWTSVCAAVISSATAAAPSSAPASLPTFSMVAMVPS